MPFSRAFFLFLLLSLAAAATETRLDFDAAQTTVEFTRFAHGARELQAERGLAAIRSALSTVNGQLVVDAASGRSGNNTRDRRMHREILESMRFPEVVFSPVRFTGEFHAQQDSQLIVHGTFRLHGAGHDIDIPVKVHPAREGYALDAVFPLPYVAWGLKNPSNFLLRVGDTATIKIHALTRATSE
ncbi:MAG TPA: YceI family protein [Bryobacteraceae bacterium]|nr:YceI family protein [Bryobacteraceae bacterium]